MYIPDPALGLAILSRESPADWSALYRETTLDGPGWYSLALSTGTAPSLSFVQMSLLAFPAHPLLQTSHELYQRSDVPPVETSR